jgi:hypothetical protein
MCHAPLIVVVRRIHIIPVGDPEPLHTATQDCLCHPLVESDGLVIHNAWDLREKWERQGYVHPRKAWVQIAELKVL